MSVATTATSGLGTLETAMACFSFSAVIAELLTKLNWTWCKNLPIAKVSDHKGGNLKIPTIIKRHCVRVPLQPSAVMQSVYNFTMDNCPSVICHNSLLHDGTQTVQGHKVRAVQTSVVWQA